MQRRTALRASDADRESVATRLRDAAADGRLLASELEERLERLFGSRTYGELDALVADLPVGHAGRRRRATPLWVRAGFAVAVILAMLAVVAIVALIALGFAGVWVLWLVAGWLFFGRRCRSRMARAEFRVVHRRTLP